MDYSLPGSSAHGILQARILDWVAIPFSRGSSQPRDRTQVSSIEGRFFTIWSTKSLGIRRTLEYEVKWTLGSITTNKASGSDGLPVELFQILKDDAVKVLYSVCQQIWKTQQWPQDWKRSVFIPIPKKGNAKECANCHVTALISHASKVMLKILQVRLLHLRTSRCSSWI